MWVFLKEITSRIFQKLIQWHYNFAYPPLNMGEDINFVLPCRQWSHSLVVPLVHSMMKGCCEKWEWKGGKLTFEWTGNLASHPTIRTNQLQKTDTHLRAQNFIMLWIMDHCFLQSYFLNFQQGSLFKTSTFMDQISQVFSLCWQEFLIN